MKHLRIASGLLLALATIAAPAQERDILDAVLEHPLGTTGNGEPVGFGDPELNNAEIWLRDYLPRPWTTTRIDALFTAAYTRFVKPRKVSNFRRQHQVADEPFLSLEMMEHLGRVLAASRDPRAALALGRVIRAEESAGNGILLANELSRGLLDYFGSDASYRHPPAEEVVNRACYGGCGIVLKDALKWLQLNQHELEQRAAALTAGSPPCAACQKEALAAIDQLRKRLYNSAPTLRLTIKGGGKPRFVEVHYDVLPISGGVGGARGGTYSDPFTSPNMRINIPSNVLGRSDMRLSGMVISPGYRSVLFELDRINDARVVPITLVPLPSKTLTGTITFSGDSKPRRLGLRASLSLSGANEPTGLLSNGTNELQDIAKAVVDRHGRFSIVVPDITQDPILNAPGNRYKLAPHDHNWVLLPDAIALDHPPGTTLNIIAAPRPGSPASKKANPGPPLPVTGRVIDADDRPVPEAQVVIVNNARLKSLHCPENGDACFPVLQTTGAARALGVSSSDGTFTLQVPVGLMLSDSVWAEGRDADGRSVRTSWQVGWRQPLPTSSLGDIRLDQWVDFTLVVRGDGRPIAGAEVDYGYKVDGDEYSGTRITDATGAVQFHQQVSRGGRPCCMPMTIHAAGFASETWNGGIPMGTSTKVIELEREAMQRGRVVDAGSRALGNVTVQAHAVERSGPAVALRDPFPNEKSGTARTDDTGAFTLRGLHGGKQYRLVVISADGAMTDGERTITAGDTPVVIVVPAAPSGSGERKP